MSINLKELQKSLNNTGTIMNLSSIFEITSTIKINSTKSSVFASQKFYLDLFSLYQRLVNAQKLDELPKRSISYNKTLSLVVTSSGSFSGPADNEILRLLDSDTDTAGSDIAMIGKKGVSILTAKGRKMVLAFDSPDISRPIDVTPLADLIKKYKNAYCIHQTFISIADQKIIRVNLIPSENIISEQGIKIDIDSFILEPEYLEIMNYLESVILNITLTQIIFEARLSEYANRFKTTTVINEKAKESIRLLKLQYNQAKRRVKDEALRAQLFQGVRR